MQTFVDFLSQAAPEGETILIVRQKPRIYEGKPALHGDGTPKYSWVPCLPERYNEARQAAWYANTAVYIVDRFKDGKLSAGAGYAEHVAFMVLDDIGTKSKTPPVEPTWKIETSPGNFQWGYVFDYDQQPKKGEFTAAIVAIADAGYTDRGAINAVRNFRIPGSINLKAGRDNFAATLTEFHSERTYLLESLCQQFGVTPAAADTATHAHIALQDDGNDPVLAWLTERGLVLAAPNGEGWAGVVCPNHAEHSDHNPEGRYHSVHRAYDCFHEHCGDWSSERFLRWVEDEGGPKAGYGLRDDLLALTMESALSKITPTEAFPDAAQVVIEEVRRRELGRLTKSEWFERFAYLQDDDAYFDMLERREISRGTFNALYRHIQCRSIRSGRVVEASVCYDEHRQEKGAHSLIGVTYAAGEDILVARSGLVYGNRWRNARPAVSGGGDVSAWLAHAERMLPDPAERAHVLNVMAYKVQHPNRKINHAVLHAGRPGSGKDTLWAPFLWAVGGPLNVNVSLVRNEELMSQWGYALEAEIMVINELRQAEAKDRRALENQLKPIIAAPPELLPVNRKGLHPYNALNRVFVLAFSNERAAISLPSDDRRWMVVWSEVERLPEADAERLWSWYKSGGFESIACWLSSYDVSKFNPGAVPPMTEAKAIMIDAGMSTAESYLVEMMRARAGEFARGVVGSPFHAVCDRVAGSMPPGVKVPQSALLHALREAGWIDLGRIASGDYPSKKHLFCAPGMLTLSKSDLRRMVETPQAPSLAIVKNDR
jgi:hypothetical protein